MEDYGPELNEAISILQRPNSDGSLKRATITIKTNANAALKIMDKFLNDYDDVEHDDIMVLKVADTRVATIRGTNCYICAYEIPKGQIVCDKCEAEHPGVGERLRQSKADR